MNRLKQRFAAFNLSPLTAPLLLLGITLLSYAILLPWLGFYWDEWPMTWIAHKLGSDGLARYFATNRPYWGMIYRLTTPILGFIPWHWQVFGLFWRWMTAVSLWATLRRVWPQRTDAALWASILFLVYPGFSQQSIGMMYGHFFVVLTAFLLSLWCSLASLQYWRSSLIRFWLLTGAGLVLALVNLLSMEYFFLLELLRPALIYTALWWQQKNSTASEQKPAPRTCPILRRAALHWLPYLAVFLTGVIWRAFFFRFQTQNYNFSLVDQFKANPFNTILSLAANVVRDLALVTAGAWAKPFLPWDVRTLGSRTAILAALLVLLVLIGLVLYLLKIRTAPQEKRGRSAWAISAILLGVLGLVLAGPPFWLTHLPIGLTYPNDRFTLPFMLGSSLLLAGLLALLPGRRVFKILLLSVLVAASAGLHFQESATYRRDWTLQKSLFWQMSWRMPAIQPGTILLSSDLPTKYVSDNSLTGPLNWIFAPENHSERMSYMFYFASLRSLSRPLLEKGRPVQQDYLAADFTGSTDQMLTLNDQTPACLRVLDPDLDPLNKMIPEVLRQSAQLSNSRWILPQVPAGSAPPDLTPSVFGDEPAHGWCYYFEKADLARQQADWPGVVKLGDLAFALNDYPNDPMERLPFLEGYAHQGNWDRAHDLTATSAAISPLMQPVLCRLWLRIDETTPSSPLKSKTVQAVREELACQ